MPGTSTSTLEVTNISKHGFWLLLDGRELFLPFEDFPWFEPAPVGAILRLERPAPGHLRWSDLDVDLAIDSIEHPELPAQIQGLKSKIRQTRYSGRFVRRRRTRLADGCGRLPSWGKARFVTHDSRQAERARVDASCRDRHEHTQSVRGRTTGRSFSWSDRQASRLGDVPRPRQGRPRRRLGPRFRDGLPAAAEVADAASATALKPEGSAARRCGAAEIVRGQKRGGRDAVVARLPVSTDSSSAAESAEWATMRES